MKEIALMVTIGVAAVAYLSVLVLWWRGRHVRQKHNKHQFFMAMVEGMRNGTVGMLEDVVDIYRGSHDRDMGTMAYRYGLGRHLRECMVKLITRELDDTLDDKTICLWKERISQFIRLNEERSPYEELPPPERNLLSDVSDYISTGNAEGVNRKLLELRGILLAKTDELNRTRGVNRWSVPLSVIGVVFTIVFGLLSILHEI